MVILLIVIGSALVLISYFYSSIFARYNQMNENSKCLQNPRYIYNEKGTKLCADFEIYNDSESIAVFYLGYCDININSLKKFYHDKNFSTIVIYANGCLMSHGKKKQTEKVLVSDLKLWFKYFENMFGRNQKVVLHGFSDTALSVYMCSQENNVKAVVLDSIHLFPLWIYKNIKNKLLLRIFKKKSRIDLSRTFIPALICSPKTLSNDAYKIYDLCENKKSLLIYEYFNDNDFFKKLTDFITRAKLLEE